MVWPVMPSTSAGESPRAAASASTVRQIGVVGVSTGGNSLRWMRGSGTSSSKWPFSGSSPGTFSGSSSRGLIGAGELQVVLGHEAEDHLAADRGDPAHAGHGQQRGHAVLLGQAVAAVGLDRL